jgi:hypothetical protein
VAAAWPIQQSELGDLEAFAAALRRRRVRAAAVDAAVRVVLAFAVPGLALAWLLPAWRAGLAVFALLAVAVAAAAAVRRAGRTPDAELLAGDEVAAAAAGGAASPRLLAEVGDELATWLERRGARTDAMTAWLEADVRSKLPALPPRAVAAVGRRRLGGLLWALPLALLLLLAWIVADLLSPPWSGVLGGRSNAPSLGGGAGGGSGQGEGRGDGEPSPAPPDEGQRPPADDAVPPPPPQGQDQPPFDGAPEEPAPLLELPAQQRFVVPDFVGDGPTRRAKVRAVEIEQGAPQAPAPTAVGGADLRPELPPMRPETFARAAEQALGARHVPAAERPFVQRYFDRLQQAGK